MLTHTQSRPPAHALTPPTLSPTPTPPRSRSNRQLQVFVEMVRWWRPRFVLMENVQDILKKEDGAYMKYALGSMLSLRYQVMGVS